MSLDYIVAVFAAHIPNPTDKLVALAVADYANRETGKAWPSLAALQGMTSLCERAVRNSLRRLEADGHLTSQRGEGRGLTSCYWLHPKGPTGAPLTVQKEDPQSSPPAQNGAPDAPLRSENGAPNAPFSPQKGAPNAPIDSRKGASGAEKGAFNSIKGAPDAPEPVITVKNRKSIPTQPAARPTLEDMLEFGAAVEISNSDIEILFWKWKGNGWVNGGTPIRDWQATLRSWKKANYLPSQKSDFGGSRKPEAAAAPQKKAARSPDELVRLMAIHRRQYPGSSVQNWADLPLDCRREAERTLAVETAENAREKKAAAAGTPALL